MNQVIRWSARLAGAALLVAMPLAMAQSYNTISPADLKQRLESANKPMLLDIQVEDAVATPAYPAKTDAERSKLKPAISKILSSKDDVVIVCPAGGGGARNTYDFLKSQGVPESRMKILEKGQKGWPYKELITQGK
jgi:rhodanese-related sulfurtransferase